MIKGLVPTLAEGGKIKIGGLGAEKQKRDGTGTYRIPVKLDHFRITTTQRNDTGDLIDDTVLMEGLPLDADGKLREIPIVLHADEIDMVFPTQYALYTGKKLFCRGDGETAQRYELKNKERTGLVKELACPCPYLNAASGPVCKPHGTLHCSIRAVDRAVAGAVYKWRTTSIISIQRMIGSMQQILSVCGTLTGIPLVLRLEPIQVSPPGAQASTVYCCHLELRAIDLGAVQRDAIAAAQMRDKVRHAIGYRALLQSPGDDESDEEAEEVQQEFHPEAGQSTVAMPQALARVDEPPPIQVPAPEPPEPLKLRRTIAKPPAAKQPPDPPAPSVTVAEDPPPAVSTPPVEVVTEQPVTDGAPHDNTAAPGIEPGELFASPKLVTTAETVAWLTEYADDPRLTGPAMKLSGKPIRTAGAGIVTFAKLRAAITRFDEKFGNPGGWREAATLCLGAPLVSVYHTDEATAVKLTAYLTAALT